jgi:hypothetical protein
MTTKKNSRRSWLIVPADQADALTSAQPQGADVIVLDLEYTVAPKNKDKCLYVSIEQPVGQMYGPRSAVA